MPLIKNPTYAPVRVTSVQLILGAGTNELRSEPPPGWVEEYRSTFSNTSEFRARNEDRGSGESSKPSEPLDPPASANPGPKEYVFSKRKIYNSPLTKYWIIHYGERLQVPPPEIDTSRCYGPAVFVNVLPNGERQIWLWSADQKTWDTVSIKDTVDLDVKRQLNLNSKNIPVFVAARASREKEETESSQFVQYLAPQSS